MAHESGYTRWERAHPQNGQLELINLTLFLPNARVPVLLPNGSVRVPDQLSESVETTSAAQF
jgi:hypothetical protein